MFTLSRLHFIPLLTRQILSLVILLPFTLTSQVKAVLPYEAEAARDTSHNVSNQPDTYSDNSLAAPSTLVIQAISPSQGLNDSPTNVTVTGNNFVATPTVHLNNVPLENVTFLNSKSISASVPEDLPGGVYTLTVTNPDHQFASLVNAFTVQWSGDGSLSSWHPTTHMTIERSWPAAVVVGNYVYVLGGWDRNLSSLNSVERATINDDGSLSSWSLMSSMTTGRLLFSALKIGRYLYAIGGYSSGSTERTVINANGTLGQWEAFNLPGTNSQVAVLVGDYVYSFGNNNVQWAPIISEDEIGSWQPAPNMNLPRGFMGVAALGNYLYAIGGQTDGYANMNQVERAAINEDGSLGSWQLMPSLSLSRCNLAAVAAYGYIYALGGGTCFGNVYSSVERATINVNGLAKPWEFISSMSSQRYRMAVVRAKSYIYAIGGEDAAGMLNTVEMAEINPATKPVIDPYEYGMTINEGALFTNQTGVTLTIGARPGTPLMMVSNDGGFAWATWEPYSLLKAWTITQYGAYIIPRVVYVKYRDNQGNTTSTYQDDIILDVTPPTGTVTITPPGEMSLAEKDKQNVKPSLGQIQSSASYTSSIYLPIIYGPPPIVTLNLNAQDDVSGVEGMIISNSPSFSNAKWEQYATTKLWEIPSLTGTITVYVKFRDYAGNVSSVIEGTYTP